MFLNIRYSLSRPCPLGAFGSLDRLYLIFSFIIKPESGLKPCLHGFSIPSRCRCQRNEGIIEKAGAKFAGRYQLNERFCKMAGATPWTYLYYIKICLFPGKNPGYNNSLCLKMAIDPGELSVLRPVPIDLKFLLKESGSCDIIPLLRIPAT